MPCIIEDLTTKAVEDDEMRARLQATAPAVEVLQEIATVVGVVHVTAITIMDVVEEDTRTPHLPTAIRQVPVREEESAGIVAQGLTSRGRKMERLHHTVRLA